MDKIQKIRDNLTGNPTYEPTKKVTSRLAEFRPFDQTEVKKIILSMKSKSCKLDALPTRLLKECIEHILPTITNLTSHKTDACSAHAQKLSRSWNQTIEALR